MDNVGQSNIKTAKEESVIIRNEMVLTNVTENEKESFMDHEIVQTGFETRQILSESLNLTDHKEAALVWAKKVAYQQSHVATKLAQSIKDGRSISETFKQHMCETCGKTFKYQHSLKNHIRTHTGDRPYACNMCDRKFAEAGNLSKHKKSHIGIKQFVCGICGKGFVISAGLKQHMKVHSTKQYLCNICGKESARSGDFVKHLLTHSDKKLYKCQVCGKSFTQKSDLREHRVVHNKPKPFLCELCGKEFSKIGFLNNHKTMSNCLGTPTSCHSCGVSFATQALLNKHKMVHRSKSQSKDEEEPCYTCPICVKVFDQADKVDRHFVVHMDVNEVACSMCDVKFTKPSELHDHEKKHDKSGCEVPATQLPYRCSVCDKSFTRIRSFNKHVKIHPDGKQYVCELCGKMFHTGYFLKLHKRFHQMPSKVACGSEEGEVKKDVDMEQLYLGAQEAFTTEKLNSKLQLLCKQTIWNSESCEADDAGEILSETERSSLHNEHDYVNPDGLQSQVTRKGSLNAQVHVGLVPVHPNQTRIVSIQSVDETESSMVSESLHEAGASSPASHMDNEHAGEGITTQRLIEVEVVPSHAIESEVETSPTIQSDASPTTVSVVKSRVGTSPTTVTPEVGSLTTTVSVVQPDECHFPMAVSTVPSHAPTATALNAVHSNVSTFPTAVLSEGGSLEVLPSHAADLSSFSERLVSGVSDKQFEIRVMHADIDTEERNAGGNEQDAMQTPVYIVMIPNYVPYTPTTSS